MMAPSRPSDVGLWRLWSASTTVTVTVQVRRIAPRQGGPTIHAAPTDRLDSARAHEQYDLARWHARSWGRPLVEFAAIFGLWVGGLLIGLWAERWPTRATLVLPLTLISGQLFTIAHDAGHGSYSTSRAVNGIVGRLALVPSVHVLGLWREHHNLHHRYTNLRSHDFVWTPLSIEEYSALPRHRRALHRLYRHPSSAGLGLHYAIEIWAPRMLWPRASHGLPNRRRRMADSLALGGLLAAIGFASLTFVRAIDPDRASQPAFWIGAFALLFVLPLIGTQWLIGFVIYLNHTHPNVVWFDDADEWARHDVQLEGSTGLLFHRYRHLFMPRRIMNHTAHHVDPRVPVRNLARAQQQLVAVEGTRIVTSDFSWRWLSDVLRRCQLYDYRAQRWVTMRAAEESI